MSKIKIFVAIHQNNCFIPQCDLIQPIQVGAAQTESKFPAMLQDNTGDNISVKNPMYCELTAQYWAWKNMDCDYYGFFHYRRYLSFNPNINDTIDSWNIVVKNYLCDSAVEELHITDRYVDSIKKEIEKYDVLTMRPSDLEKACGLTVYEQYKKDGAKLHIEDLDTLLDIIQEKYPEFYEIAHSYLNGYVDYIGNIFIMKKELFHNYCQWLYDILAEFEKRTDMSNYSVEGYRTPGHLGERLFGIYYTWLKRTKSIKNNELQLVFFSNTEARKELKPAFEKNNIPIAMVSNENYAPFYAAMIQSLAQNSSLEYNYDLIFLQRDFQNKTKKLFENMLRGYPNISIRFYNVGPFFADSQLNVSPTIPIETYFKLIIPELFKEFPKVLYLDGDMIIKADVSELFRTDISEYLLAAVIDIAAAGVSNGFDNERKNYVLNYMRMKNPLKQFNAGVLLINTARMRETFTTQYLLKFSEGAAFQFQDQDVLNVLCEDNVLFLDQAWNFTGDEVQGYRGYIETFAPREDYLAYREAAKEPKIIHYAGNEKPWYFPQQEWAEEFWSYFSQTPFYFAYLSKRSFEISDYVVSNHNTATNPPITFKMKVKQVIRKIADVLLPYGSARRKSVKVFYKKIRKII